MIKVWKAAVLRMTAVALVALAAPLLSAATAKPAWSYTLNFTGTVTGAGGIFSAAGILPGDPVSGALTFDLLNSTPSVALPWPDSISVFPQAAGSFTFHVTHAGAFDYTQSWAAAGQIESHGSPQGDRLGLNVADTVAGLQLTYGTNGTIPALTSLATLPTDSSGILALLTGDPQFALGFYRINGFGTVSFNLAFAAATATTPLPAALPLLVSALGGFGLLALRRRSRTA